MQWFELANNPLVISAVYNNVPPLQAIHLQELIVAQLHHVSLILKLPYPPDKIPPRWKIRNYLPSHMDLDFFGIQSFQLDYQVPLSSLVNIDIKRTTPRSIAVDIHAANCKIFLEAGCFRIQRLIP